MKVAKPTTSAEKSTKTVVDTILFSRKEIEEWQLPPYHKGGLKTFQREARVNDNVRALAQAIANDGGVLPGVITFGVLNKNKTEKFLLDGQQRRSSFLLSGKEEGVADVRVCFFDSVAEMAQEFVELNSHLSSMKPDDILRGLEPALPALQEVREACPFVGYDMVRRCERSPVLSMSVLIRCWAVSAGEVPGGAGKSSKLLALELAEPNVKDLIAFLQLAYAAWGRDVEYRRLWSALNLSLCMWLYRRIVVGSYSAKTQRLSPELFQKCLMSLSASPVYLDWLTGRHVGERDRAPAYNRIKGVFAARIQTEQGGKKPLLPAPVWAHS